jgi:hypothetical protein
MIAHVTRGSVRTAMTRLIAFVFAVVLPLASIAQDGQRAVTPAAGPQTQVDDIVAAYTKMCLTVPPISQTNEFARALLLWQHDAELCACNAKSLRTSLTPEVLSGTKEQLQEFLLRWGLSGQASCVVPFLKQKMQAECIPLYRTEMQSQGKQDQLERRVRQRGFKDTGEFIEGVCTCANTAFSKVDTEEWTQIAVDGYNRYLEARRTGQSPAPQSNPLTDGMEECMQKLLN